MSEENFNSSIEEENPISRRTALKYMGAGALSAAGAIYGLSNNAFANTVVGDSPITSTPNTGKMKVLLINGSPRKNGNTFLALTEASKALEAEGVETKLIQIGTSAVHGCIACGACYHTGECVFKDDVYTSIRSELADSDGLIVGSPVYYSGPNGALCAILDRLFYTSGSLLKYKVGSAIAICRRGGASATLDRLNKYFTITNMNIVGSQYWNLAHGMDIGDVLEDHEGLQIMRTLGRNMAWTIKNMKTANHPSPEPEPRISTHFIRK